VNQKPKRAVQAKMGLRSEKMKKQNERMKNEKWKMI
jgi:hypothetical protein